MSWDVRISKGVLSMARSLLSSVTMGSSPRLMGTSAIGNADNAFIDWPQTMTGISLLDDTDLQDETLSASRLSNNPETSKSSAQPVPMTIEHQVIPVKANIAISQREISCASAMLKGCRAPFDADCLSMLPKGQEHTYVHTNMDEFGMGSDSQNSAYGPVTNGLFSSGGSSGGSAVAVARGQATVALGTDTGGSVRLPAAYSGVFGFKPSYGRISRFGVVPYANSLDTVGVFGSTVNDIRCLLMGSDRCASSQSDPTSLIACSRSKFLPTSSSEEFALESVPREWKDLKVGIPKEYSITEMSPPVREAWTEALVRLKAKGCQLVPISLPMTSAALPAYYIIAAAEAASNLAKYDGIRYGSRATSHEGTLYASTRSAGFGPEVRRRILLGSYTLCSHAMDNHFLHAQKIRRLIQRDFDRVFAKPNILHDPEQFDLSDMEEATKLKNKQGPPQVDVIICPTAPRLAPKLSELTCQRPVDAFVNDVFTVPASMAGLPALSVPLPVSGETQRTGRKVGIQVLGQFWDDALTLYVGSLLAECFAKNQRPARDQARKSGDVSYGDIAGYAS